MSMLNLIREAYIDPIRSVMVVDDEYPTLPKLISGHDNSKEEDRARLSDVVNLCRKAENNWMLDVHDGEFDGIGDVDNLHHSDLLILDYHLEGSGDNGKGDKALKVLASLAKKDHFNLVVVHTKGYADFNNNDGYKAVFEDIVFDLQTEKKFRDMPSGMLKQVEAAIDAWEDEREGVLNFLIDCIPDLDYLKLAQIKSGPMRFFNLDLKELDELKLYYKNRPIGVDSDIDKLHLGYLTWYILKRKGEKISKRFGGDDLGDLRWSTTEEFLWAKAGNLFVVVVGKTISTSELPDKLLGALQNWGPHPHRMLLAKLRHKLDEHGFLIASDLLDKKHTQAGWLRELLYCDSNELENKSWVTTQNHLEELAWNYKTELSQFLANIVRNLIKDGGEVSQVEGIFSDDGVLADDLEIFKSVNAFNNAIPVDGNHLTTGHVLQDQSNNLYLVVTPACDLVPGRTGHQKIEVVLQKLYPVTSALKKDSDSERLHPKVLLERCRDLVNSKQLVFLRLEGGIKIHATTSMPFKNGNPSLVSVAVENDGVWDDCRKLNAYSLDLSHTPPEVKTREYVVVGQLRYEYALHHSKISGEYVSRIGLDYIQN